METKVVWNEDININNEDGYVSDDIAFTFTALVFTDPGAPADELIEIYSKWSGNWYAKRW